eukprot:5498203-Prymnesium_polylepis.6
MISSGCVVILPCCAGGIPISVPDPRPQGRHVSQGSAHVYSRPAASMKARHSGVGFLFLPDVDPRPQ